ncbi:DUF7742 family protein [Albidovulum sp.]
MRTITHGDVVAAARAILSRPEGAARRDVARWLEQAHAADLFRRRFRRCHPLFGNGSLAGAVPYVPGPEPFLSDERYLQAIATVIEAILDWRHRRAG